MAPGVYARLTGWVGCSLLVLLLYRGLVGGTLKRYPLFYSYVTYVVITSVWALCEYSAFFQRYYWYYWLSEFVAFLLAFGVT